jgi:hypothetical protein
LSILFPDIPVLKHVGEMGWDLIAFFFNVDQWKKRKKGQVDNIGVGDMERNRHRQSCMNKLLIAKKCCRNKLK